MRLLFVLAYYHPYIGGAESVFRQLTAELARRGHAVRVLTTALPGAPAHEELDGVAVTRVATPRRGDRHFFSLLSLPAAAAAARAADVVHTAPYNGALPAFLGARLAGRPVVFTALEVLGRRWATVEPRPLHAAAYRLVEAAVMRLPYDRYAAISRATLADALAAGAPAARSRVIYCGVDPLFRPGPAEGLLRRRMGLPAGAPLFVYFGRPGITKGVEVLLRAMPALLRAVPEAHLALILAREPAAQRARLAAMAAELGGGQTQLLEPLPSRAELARHLRDADCVVVPSLTEGFGLSAAEACALGLPVVATTAGALPEVVGGRHVLVPPGCPQALAEGMARAARGRYDQPGAPRQFSYSLMADAYEELYREVAPCA